MCRGRDTERTGRLSLGATSSTELDGEGYVRQKGTPGRMVVVLTVTGQVMCVQNSGEGSGLGCRFATDN